MEHRQSVAWAALFPHLNQLEYSSRVRARGFTSKVPGLRDIACLYLEMEFVCY
jgi:hypothetical protein